MYEISKRLFRAKMKEGEDFGAYVNSIIRSIEELVLVSMCPMAIHVYRHCIFIPIAMKYSFASNCLFI